MKHDHPFVTPNENYCAVCGLDREAHNRASQHDFQIKGGFAEALVLKCVRCQLEIITPEGLAIHTSYPCSAPEPVERERHGWEVTHGVTCVSCPGCGFTFAAAHEDAQGGSYSCPDCDREAPEPVDLLPCLRSDCKAPHGPCANPHQHRGWTACSWGPNRENAAPEPQEEK